ncbi:hypothetical protein [Paenibacillus campinasensis]|uniref:Uncharacterized protein n=1 Tax=Paenibacillus campinasensis TaxID=66347 RepID=A0A268EPT1_9BACL|nr:hypothetical protein [Paenibacillus campinasensis]PAD75128.1 hypothetical protein CHH67_16015 [Paenibacillus campinasensis]
MTQVSFLGSFFAAIFLPDHFSHGRIVPAPLPDDNRNRRNNYEFCPQLAGQQSGNKPLTIDDQLEVEQQACDGRETRHFEDGFTINHFRSEKG